MLRRVSLRAAPLLRRQNLFASVLRPSTHQHQHQHHAACYSSDSSTGQEKKTKLYNFHVENKGIMVPFGGWMMPVYYKDKSIIESHKWCREKASIFDVSHMGQLTITGKDRLEFIEKHVPGDIKELPVNSSRLTQFTNEKGGIMDDTIVTKKEDHLYVIVNAGCAEQDIAYLQSRAEKCRARGKDIQVNVITDHSLIAIQGPMAITVVQRYVPEMDLNEIPFMGTRDLKVDGVMCRVARCGYTGEDGFEISIPSDHVEAFVKKLLTNQETSLAGLGPRDTLRLEAGLCLMGHDMNSDITPVEADIMFTISKRRRQEGGFIGDAAIQKQLKDGVSKLRVGFTMEGKVIARDNYKVFNEDGSKEIGIVTSGTFSPTLNKGIGMGYVETAYSPVGTTVQIDVRGKKSKAVISKMPFVPHRYVRKPKKQ